VLSVAKLRVGQEAYQLSGVAQSLDDYYTGAGEAAGRWAGARAERLGLSGEVAPDDLRAVSAGMAPWSGGLTPNGETIRTHPRRVPGFDLTYKTSATLPATGIDGASPIRDPLGVAARDPEQGAERTLLSIAIGHAGEQVRPDRTLDRDVVDRGELTFMAFDDGLSW
jgi:hypothetical protein